MCTCLHCWCCETFGDVDAAWCFAEGMSPATAEQNLGSFMSLTTRSFRIWPANVEPLVSSLQAFKLHAVCQGIWIYRRTLSSRDGQQLRLSYRLLAHILYVVRPELGRVAAKKPPASEMLRVLQDVTKVLRDATIYDRYSYVRVNLNNNIKEVLLQHVCFI